MKKIFAFMGLVASASILLTNCSRNLDIRSAEKGSFSIIALTGDTKTANNGALGTNWVALDSINVFHAENGTTTYGTNDAFEITADDLAAGLFTGNLTEELDPAKTYDWYALYPYTNKLKTPAAAKSGDGYFYLGCNYSHNTAQVQKGNSNKEHLAGKFFPLYAKATAAAGTTPVFNMEQVASVVCVCVTNKTKNPLTVTDITFTAEQEDIIGSYFINFTGTGLTFTPSGANYVSKTAKLSVTDGEPIAENGYEYFYMAIKPFTNVAGKSLTVSVNGTEKTITSAATFAPGVIKTLEFDYDKVAEIPTYTSLTDLANRAGKPTAEGKTVNVTFDKETITYINSSKVCFNVKIQGEQETTQEITVYKSGVPSTWKLGGWINGTLSKCNWQLFNNTTWELIPSGDYSTLTCTNPVETPVISIKSGSATITCATEGATIRYTTDGSDPTETSAVYSAAISVNEGQTIKAIAFKDNCPASEIASKKYYDGEVAEITVSIFGSWSGYNDKTGTVKGTDGNEYGITALKICPATDTKPTGIQWRKSKSSAIYNTTSFGKIKQIIFEDATAAEFSVKVGTSEKDGCTTALSATDGRTFKVAEGEYGYFYFTNNNTTIAKTTKITIIY